MQAYWKGKNRSLLWHQYCLFSKRGLSVQIGLVELWGRQHQLARVLKAAGVKELLEMLVEKSQPSPSMPWVGFQGPSGASEELYTSPRVDAIKVRSVITANSCHLLRASVSTRCFTLLCLTLHLLRVENYKTTIWALKNTNVPAAIY